MVKTITFVRHAQASFGADNYDQLSPLGYQQSQWLGQFWASTGQQFDAVITGAMARHKQTAKTALAELRDPIDHQIDARWNEFAFQKLVKSYLARNGELQADIGRDKRLQLKALKLSLQAWIDDELPHDQIDETWAEFLTRVTSALNDLPEYKNLLVISSGGALSAALCHILKAPAQTMIALNLQTANSAVHQCVSTREGIQLTRFNHLPHLVDKNEHITFF